MAWVSLFVLLASLARAVREAAIAHRYGVGAEVDAYLFVFNLVNWPVGVWLSVLTVVLVPMAARLRRSAPLDLPRLRSELLGLAILIGLALGLIAVIVLPLVLRSSWTGLSAATASLAAGMVPGLALLAPLGVLIGLFSAWTLASGRHVNSLLEGVPAVVLVAALLVLPGKGVATLLWGTVAGFAFHLAVLALLLARRGELGSGPSTVFTSPHWAAFWQGFGIMLAGQALMSLIVVVDQFFAAQLGVGSIALLGYANRIIALVLGLGALAVSRATLPVFARARPDNAQGTADLARQWSVALFALGGIAVLFGWWLAPWAVAALFERGAFTSGDTRSVAEVLRYGLLQVPFYFSALVLTSYLSSRSLYIWLFWSGLLGLSAKVLGNVLLIPAHGVAGIALATALAYAVNFAFFWWAFRTVTRSG